MGDDLRVARARSWATCFALAVTAALGCQRTAARADGTPRPAQIAPDASRTDVRPVAPAASAAPAEERPPPAEKLASHGAERVEADVVRVKTLEALLVEANEIRCPHVVRSKFPPVQKEMEPWQLEGDLVEADRLKAHVVVARLVIADEIEAMVVKKAAKPYRWPGAGGSQTVRNRVTLVKGAEAPTSAAPVF